MSPKPWLFHPPAKSPPLLLAIVEYQNVFAPLIKLEADSYGKCYLQNVPADQQRLIYKGRILKDDQTLDSYGAAFFSQTVAVNDVTIKFEIWDTAGQERYHSLAPMYYRGAAAAFIVYDITNQSLTQRQKQLLQQSLQPSWVQILA